VRGALQDVPRLGDILAGWERGCGSDLLTDVLDCERCHGPLELMICGKDAVVAVRVLARRPGTIPQQVFHAQKIARHVAVDDRDPETRIDRETAVLPGEHVGGDSGVKQAVEARRCRARRCKAAQWPSWDGSSARSQSGALTPSVGCPEVTSQKRPPGEASCSFCRSFCCGLARSIVGRGKNPGTWDHSSSMAVA